MNTPAVKYEVDELIKDFKSISEVEVLLPVSCHHRQGMKILEHYQPHFWETEDRTGQSIAKHWTNDEIMNKAKERTSKYYKVLYKSELRRNLAFYSKACLPTMYRPILSKGIVIKYNAKQVLDPCVGWGGRMLGSVVIPDVYFTGIEPFSKTYKGLCDIANEFKFQNRVQLFNQGAEDVLPSLQSGFYDLVLTSPPYFDLEVYSHEETQSIIKYPTWETWCDKFLDVLIKECLRCLKPTGISAWSVKNIGKYKLQNKVFELHKKYGWVNFATEGMKSTPRNSGKISKITEETFIFRRA